MKLSSRAVVYAAIVTIVVLRTDETDPYVLFVAEQKERAP